MSSVVAASDSSILLLDSDLEERVREDGDRHHSTGGTLQTLCARCRSIDFAYLGFHDSSDYSGSRYSVRREHTSISTSSESCAFCYHVLMILQYWMASHDRPCTFDICRSQVEIGLETDWHDIAGSKHQAHSDRIRITWTIPKRGFDEESWQTESLTFFLQRCDKSLQENLVMPALPESARKLDLLQPYTARCRPLKADMTLFRRWKELCLRHHGAKCSQIFKGTPRIYPRVIDVDRRCLTTANEGDGWVCLSYVWGRTDALRLTKANVTSFALPGSLTSSILPRIAEDALQVTRGLGEKYLWIDSLCIVQDDPIDKAKFISQMDSIYALASIVLIAATCISANSSLPGVSPNSRHQIQAPFTVKDVAVVQSLDPALGVKPDLRTGRITSYLGTTEWDTRAWTLQERFLSARSLVFTAEQIFWECEEAFWCEDSVRELPSISADIRRSSLCGGELYQNWSSDIPTLDHFYRTLLGDYSGRSLSFQNDALNAFSGIIRAFERSAGHKFIWGMPSAFLESALAWGSRTYRLRRRIGHAPTVDAMNEKDWFPSWSWAGWTSGEDGRLHNQNLTTEALGIEFFYHEGENRLCQLEQNSSCNTNVDLLVEGSDLPDHQSRPRQVSMDDIPREVNIDPSSLLFFWTAAATLTATLQPASSQEEDSGGWELRLSQDGQDMHASWSHVPEFSPSQVQDGVKVEAIAVAQNRGEWDGGHVANGAIGIMLVRWEAGIAFRQGFAWVAIRDWTALRGRRWQLVVLG